MRTLNPTNFNPFPTPFSLNSEFSKFSNSADLRDVAAEASEKKE